MLMSFEKLESLLYHSSYCRIIFAPWTYCGIMLISGVLSISTRWQNLEHHDAYQEKGTMPAHFEHVAHFPPTPESPYSQYHAAE